MSSSDKMAWPLFLKTLTTTRLNTINRLVYQVDLPRTITWLSPCRPTRLSIVVLAVAGGLWLLGATFSPRATTIDISPTVSPAVLPDHSSEYSLIGICAQKTDSSFTKSTWRCPTKTSRSQNYNYQCCRTRFRGGAVKKQRSDCNYVGSKFSNIRHCIDPQVTVSCGWATAPRHPRESIGRRGKSMLFDQLTGLFSRIGVGRSVVRWYGRSCARCWNAGIVQRLRPHTGRQALGRALRHEQMHLEMGQAYLL